MNMVALIPARAGSKRLPGKNVKPLAGHPLIAYTIHAALESGVFSLVLVSSDEDIEPMFRGQGAKFVKRPAEFATDDSPDIQWVKHALGAAVKWHENYDKGAVASFAILRPTSPFRTAETIRRAYKQFTTSEVHSIRAVQPVQEHPGKMWFIENGCLQPALTRAPHGHGLSPIHGPCHPDGTPWHSSPTQLLPKAYIQNASLEMAWSYVVASFGTISGNKIAPFVTTLFEGFDLNYPYDWERAEAWIESGAVQLPDLTLSTAR